MENQIKKIKKVIEISGSLVHCSPEAVKGISITTAINEPASEIHLEHQLIGIHFLAIILVMVQI